MSTSPLEAESNNSAPTKSQPIRFINDEHETPTSRSSEHMVDSCSTPGTCECDDPCIVWQHCKKQKIGVDKAICSYCGGEVSESCKDGTRHIHKQSCKRKNPSDRMVCEAYNIDAKASRQELTKMMILHEYPLSMVEHVGFRNYVSSLHPLFRVMSRKTIESDILKMCKIKRAEIMKGLENNKSRIAISIDMWIANHQKDYMAVTAHYVDDSWVLCNQILRLVYVPLPHDAEILADVLVECLMDYQIDHNLSTLTVNDATMNDCIIDLVKNRLEFTPGSLVQKGKLFRACCAVHILNLIVGEGLKKIERGIENIRNSVAFWIATQKRKKKSEVSIRELNISYSKSFPTRWHSTYLMLHVALMYKNVFDHLKLCEPQYECLPSDDNWMMAKERCERVLVFYSSTKSFSCAKYPTANVLFSQLCAVKLSLHTWLTCGHEMIRSMAIDMIGKFEKFWNVIHEVVAISVILDPRSKMKLLQWHFSRIYWDDAEKEIEKVRKLLFDLVEEYRFKSQLSEEKNQFGISSSISQSNLVHDELSVDPLLKFDELRANHTHTRTNVAKTEIECYLEETLLPRSSDFDILAWWKINSFRYPLLQRIARDFLASPMSSVASKSAFSTGERTVSQYQSEHSETLEALVCTKDWLLHEMQGSCSAMIKSNCFSPF